MSEVEIVAEFNRCVEIAEINNLRILPSGVSFEIIDKDESVIINIDNIECLFYFITGYDWGNSNADI